MVKNNFIAAKAKIDRDFCCFTTNRDFNADRAGWKSSSSKLSSILTGMGYQGTPNFAYAGQVHGNRVVTLCETNTQYPALIHQCDGLATTCRGIFLVIRTADCLPVVLLDPLSGIFGACHAGWRGTYGQILERLIEELEGLGANRSRLKGWIGPGICQEHYEVSEDLVQQFSQTFPSWGDFLSGRRLNLPLLNQLQAQRSGVKMESIENCGCCTYSNPDLLFSHRREGNDRGQLFTVCGFLN
jgi:purine-nucleoside/S-methyl-5'-thioadenosine phosphorylase / adenosine deaminase